MNRLATAAALAAISLGTQQLAAQQPKQTPHDTARQMMDTRQMRVMDSMNARLDTLVGRMNRATGNAKVTAMAQVINELVSQRRAMQEHMQQMMRSHGKRGDDHMMMKMDSGSESTEIGKPKADARRPGTDTSGHAGHHPESERDESR